MLARKNLLQVQRSPHFKSLTDALWTTFTLSFRSKDLNPKATSESSRGSRSSKQLQHQNLEMLWRTFSDEEEDGNYGDSDGGSGDGGSHVS